MILPTSNSNDDEHTAHQAESFDLLHEDVQRWVWNQGWNTLRPIQEEAIPVIIEENADVILSAPTAAGKTEAAFLPILSRIMNKREARECPNQGFDVVYISPLKALINDQYERLQELCDACGLPVHRRHGDVSSSKKRSALEKPDGVFLITPESVEALLLRQPSVFHRALRGVSFVVVDEVHSFIGTPRGKQLQSLLHRIETANGTWTPRIALSATIGDLDTTAEFLRPDQNPSKEDVDIVEPGDGRQKIRLSVKGYEQRNHDTAEEADGESSGAVVDIAEDISETLRGQDNLVFTNRRRDVELYSDLLNRLSEESGAPNEFYAHHGSLSREIREASERALTDASSPATVFCTTTLELGIDIGWMDSIGQIGSPPSVSSMRQRLGRSGRKGGPAVLRVYVQEPEIGSSTPVEDMLRPELVQTVAMVDLLLEHWYEPPDLDACELSTLIQQLLSLIAEHGGIQADAAYRMLCHNGPFQNVPTEQFESLLRGLAEEDLIDQAGDGDLIMGLGGEKLIRHHDFYAAFWSPDEYRLVAGETTIGTLPVTSPLIEGRLLIFAGQRWEVTSVDEDKQTAFLKKASGGNVPLFRGEGALVHTRVRKQMYATYTKTDIPKYLDSKGGELLEEGRTHFDRLDLQDRHIVAQGERTVLFLWASDRIVNTIHVLLSRRGYQASKAGMTVELQNCGPEELFEELQDIASSEPPEPSQLAKSVENTVVDKHDRYVPDDLLNANYASKRLNVKGAIREATDITEVH